MFLLFRLFLLASIAVLGVQAADSLSGEAVYQKRCAGCHEKPGDRVPSRQSLQQLPASRILRTLDFGVMITVAYPMTRDEREAVAGYLGTKVTDAGPPPASFCADRTVHVNDASKSAWNGWSPASDNARFQAAEAAGLTLDQVSHLKLKWAFAFDGDVSAFAQPAVIDNQVFVGSASGLVQALRAESGCVQWAYQAAGPVRSAMVATPLGKGHALLFGDLTGWFYAVEAETGRLLWKKRIEDHEATRLTGSPVVHDGTVYIPVASWEESRALNPEYSCCTFRGSVVALRIRDGALVWKTWVIPETPKKLGANPSGTARMGPSGGGIWSAPTLDLQRRVLYVATGDNYSPPATANSDAVLALDLLTGRILWSKQTFPNDTYNSACPSKGSNCTNQKGEDFDFGASVILARSSAGHDLLLAGQKSGMTYALDPDKKGEIVWQTRVGKGGNIGGVVWGMASDGRNVYAAVSDGSYYTTSLARKLDPKLGGGLTALRIDTGEKVWYAAPTPCAPAPASKDGCSPAQSGALTAIPGVVFSGSLDGHLRAFAAEDGKLLWNFDTVRDYQTVNGYTGKGGSLDGPGPVIVHGMVFVNSGYSRYGGIPGNVLLAFSAD